MKRAPLSLACAASMLLPLTPNTALATQYWDLPRGLMMERGKTTPEKTASFDIALGFGGLGSIFGLRLGLPFGELLLNADRSGGGSNEAALRFILPPLDMPEGMSLDWSAYPGISHLEVDGCPDNSPCSYTNRMLGGAATLNVQKMSLTLNPEWIIADDARDDNVINLALGFAYTFPETKVGVFQPNLEYRFVSGGEPINGLESDGDDYALGVRWLYNRLVTVDFSLLIRNNDQDTTSIPGFVRFNVLLQ